MVKFLQTVDVLSLRNRILREGKLKDEECVFLNDDATDTFHLGYVKDDQIISTASFHHQNREGFEGNAYQLRGMATDAAFQGKGYGNQLVNFAIVYLRGQKVNYLWCNARKKAFRFYQNLGFEFISEEFDIPGIGPHKTMYLKIQ
ncbi:GNAT family N-acetyltransferase [Pelobium sp.]|nr:GNAT family N-acetyltransferase [Pelobium sp.]MDA9555067.1 GNAT family N-acetyltransferase [Pelobium sp.]